MRESAPSTAAGGGGGGGACARVVWGVGGAARSHRRGLPFNTPPRYSGGVLNITRHPRVFAICLCLVADTFPIITHRTRQIDGGIPAPPGNGGLPERSAGARAATAAAAAAAALAAAAMAPPAGSTASADDGDDDGGPATPAAASFSSLDAAGAATATATATASESDGEEESVLLSREIKECRCCQDVLDIVSDEAGHMSPHNTVTALGRLAALLKRAPPGERAAALQSSALAAALRLFARQAPDMTPFQLVNALYSAAVMGAPVASAAPELMPAADAAVAARAHEFNDRDVCSALYAYALLRPAKRGGARGSGSGSTSSSTSSSSSNGTTSSSSNGTSSSSNSGGGGGGAAALTAPMLLAARAQSLLDTGRVEGRGVSMVLWAAGSLGLRHPGLCSAARRALLADGGAMLRGLSAQGVANCVWGMAKAGLGSLDAALLDAALARVAALGDAPRPQEVLNVLWACARARHDPLAHWAPLLAYCARRANELAPADIAALFHALGAFAHSPPPAALAPLLARAEELLPRMTALEACSLYRGLGLCGATDSGAWRALTADAVPAAWRRGELDAAAKRMAFQGFLAGRLAGAEGATLPADALADLKAAWDAGLAARPRVGGGAGANGRQRRRRGGYGAAAHADAAASSGPPAAEAAALLDQLGVRHDADVPTRDGLSVVDIQLQAGGGRWVALQVAGDHEFAANGGQKLGAAALQQALLEKAGYEVRWLAARDLAGKPPARRALYMVELLRSLGVGVSKTAARLAEERAEGGGGEAGGGGGGASASSGSSSGGASSRGSGGRGRGGRGAAASWDGGVVRVSEAELLFDDPKVAGGRGGGGGGGGRRRTGGSGSRR